jgi:hypothetical protein
MSPQARSPVGLVHDLLGLLDPGHLCVPGLPFVLGSVNEHLMDTRIYNAVMSQPIRLL